MAHSLLIHNIPTLLISSHLPYNKGTIILYHGFASSKDRIQLLGEIFAMKGYHVFIPDLPNHGERGGLNTYDSATKIAKFWPTVLDAVKESKGFIRALKTMDSSSKSFFMIGESMGGFISAAAGLLSPDIVGIASINGSCSWVETEEIFRKKDGRLELSLDEKSVLKQYNPIELFPSKPKPMLMIHGIQDEYMPIEGQEHFHAHIKNESALTSLVTFIKKYNINHTISYGMIEEILYWLDQQKGTYNDV